MNSPILAIPEIAESQNNKYITHNNAIAWLEAAMNDIYSNVAVGAGPVSLSEAQATKYFLYRVSGGSANFNLVFPATINSVNAKRIFAVINDDTTYTCTVKPSTGTGTTVTLRPGEGAIIVQSYQDMNAITPVNAYDVACNVLGQPTDGALVMKLIATRPFKVLNNFAGSVGHVGTNPASAAQFDIKKNGSAIGTVTVSTGGALTFATTSGAVSFVIGDRFEVFAPATADIDMADIALTFFGILGLTT